jgi:hypothetical protein
LCPVGEWERVLKVEMRALVEVERGTCNVRGGRKIVSKARHVLGEVVKGEC